MIHLLQGLRPDELLTSALIRASRHAMLPIHIVVKYITNRPKLAPSFFQASHLAALAEAFEVDAQALLAGHTVFPYSTAYLEPRVYDSVLNNALAVGKAATGIGATVQNVSDHVRLRLFCIDCVREDVQRWGESYWHRAHNLPGVLICTKHMRVLQKSTFRTSSGGGSWSYELPHELRGVRAIPRKATAFDVELAKKAVSLLSRVLGEQPESLPVLYREEVIEKGLLSTDRQVDTMKFIHWAKFLIGPNPIRYGFNEKEAELKWLALMVRPAADIPFTPLKHTVLQTLLASQVPVDIPLFDFSPIGYQGRICASLDKKYSRAVRKVTAAHLKSGLTVGVADTLRIANCWSHFKHNRKAFPRTERAILDLRQSAASVRRIDTSAGQNIE